ncbi:unnamed protein product [Amoebophrya sp. A25]|nr:unnamed protein product [Amoebophrya sp. A25]|eukprot:GSA25T00015430001.1
MRVRLRPTRMNACTNERSVGNVVPSYRLRTQRCGSSSCGEVAGYHVVFILLVVWSIMMTSNILKKQFHGSKERPCRKRIRMTQKAYEEAPER